MISLYVFQRSGVHYAEICVMFSPAWLYDDPVTVSQFKWAFEYLHMNKMERVEFSWKYRVVLQKNTTYLNIDLSLKAFSFWIRKQI